MNSSQVSAEPVDQAMGSPHTTEFDARDPSSDNFSGSDSDSAAADSDEKYLALTVDERVNRGMNCKERGNAALQSGDLKSARKQYTKGIRCLSSLASAQPSRDIILALYSNLALVLSKDDMLDWPGSIDAATKALDIDQNNIKARYRRAVAYFRLGELDKAKSDLCRTLELDPTNSLARKELNLLKQHEAAAKRDAKKVYGGMFAKTSGNLYADREEEQRLQKEKEEAELVLENERRSAGGEAVLTMEEWTALKSKEQNAKQESAERKKSSKPANPKSDSVVIGADDLDEEDKKLLAETKSKGYCYFRRDLTEEEKAQKAHWAPTRITQDTEKSNGASNSPSSAAKASSWNARGTTWEEKDKTAWAAAQLTERLSKLQIKKDSLESLIKSPEKMQSSLDAILRMMGSDGKPKEAEDLNRWTAACYNTQAKVSSVCSVDGDASIAVVSGSTRYLYDFEIRIKWQAEVQDFKDHAAAKKFCGEMHFSDVSSSSSTGCDWLKDGRVKIEAPPADQADRIALNSVLDDLKTEIKKAVGSFADDFKNMA